MDDVKWWFGFRQTSPKPVGQIVILGPFGSHDEALANRERSKAWDCEVSPPFIVSSKEDAQDRVIIFMA